MKAILLASIGAAHSTSSLANLTATLLDSYGPIFVRPSLAAASTVYTEGSCAVAPPDCVDVQVYIDQFQPLDMVHQTFALDGYLRSWWNDPRLAYGGSSCTDGVISFKEPERRRIWKPEFYWEGAKEITLPHHAGVPDRGELLKVYPNGDVFWSRQVAFVLSCPFARNLGRLPFDTQSCTFLMGMYAETAAEVQVRWRPGATALSNWDGACLAEWQLTDHRQEDLLQVYTSANYTYAQASLDFTRKPTLYLLIYFMPALFTVCISYLGFFIDPNATPARVALGMLCLLVVMTNYVSLARSLPPTASPPWLARFALSSFIFNVVAMVEQVAVSFGFSAKKWLDVQHASLGKALPWVKVLVQHQDKATKLFHLFDEVGMQSLTLCTHFHCSLHSMPAVLCACCRTTRAT